MKQIFTNTWAVLDKHEKKRFTVLMILDIIISIVDILSLAILLWLLQFYLRPSQAPAAIVLPGWMGNINTITLIAIFVVFFSVKNWAAYLVTRAHFNFISEVAVRISRNNLEHYQRGPFSEFIDIDSSQHLRKIAYQPFEFCQYILAGIQQIMTQSFLIALAIIAILIFNAKLFFLLLIILLPPVIVVFYLIKNKLSAARLHIKTSNTKSFQYLLDALKGYVEGNVYDRNEFFLERFAQARKRFSKHLFESLTLQTMPGRMIEVFAILGLFILIVIAQLSNVSDSTNLLTIGSFIAAAYKIIPGIVKIINSVGQIKAYEFSSDDFSKTGLVSKHVAATKAFSSLEFRNVNFEYGSKKVLTNFSCTIKKGEFIGISGDSGKGKTTIMNLMLGFISPSQGEIFADGLPANTERLKNLWPQIAYVRQQAFFIHDSIERNITLEEKEVDQKKLACAIESSGLKEFISQSAEGMKHLVSENGKNMSGGQQQRIAIARALYKDAELVLLDEPFNELDETSTISLLNHFRELCATGKTVVMITHDKKSLNHCDKLISLNDE